MTKQHREPMHPGGWPRSYNYDSLWRRLREAWWILLGRYSLHRAWQNGYDQHIINLRSNRDVNAMPPRSIRTQRND